MTLIHKEGDPNQTLYGPAHGSIRGVANCCSAAMLTGVGIRGCSSSGPVWQEKQAVHQPIASRSIPAWFKAHNSPLYRVPIDYAWMNLLSIIYDKAKTGDGGDAQVKRPIPYELWARDDYATKTWFMIDSDKGEKSRSVFGFMHWLKAQGTGVVGRIHIAPYANGAHGGQCKGAVYTPNLPKVKILLAKGLKELNAHAKAVSTTKGVAIKGMPVDDEVAKLW